MQPTSCGKYPNIYSRLEEEDRRYLQTFLTAFPDIHFDVTLTITQGDYVVVHWLGTGTQTGRSSLLLAARSRPPASRVALLDQFDNDPALFVPFALVIVFNLGLLSMTIGLWRKGIVPIWVPGLNVVGLILHFGFEELYLAHFIVMVLFAAFLSAVGVALIRHGLRAETLGLLTSYPKSADRKLILTYKGG